MLADEVQNSRQLKKKVERITNHEDASRKNPGVDYGIGLRVRCA
jgi:hypothetical protein